MGEIIQLTTVQGILKTSDIIKTTRSYRKLLPSVTDLHEISYNMIGNYSVFGQKLNNIFKKKKIVY